MVYGRTVLSQNYTKIGLKYQFFESPLCNMAVSCKGYVVLVRNGWVNECVTGGMIPSWDSQSTLRKIFHCHLVQHIPHGHLGLNLDFCGEGQVTDNMSHGTALT